MSFLQVTNNYLASDSAKWTDVVQAVSVPISLVVSWLIFRSGENSEVVKQRGAFLLDCADQCEKKVNHISVDARRYYMNPPVGSEEQVLEVEINSSIKQLGRLLSRLSTVAERDANFFFKAYAELKESITGSATDFASASRGKLKPNDNKIARIINAAHALSMQVESVRTDYLRSAKPKQNKRKSP